MKIKITWNNGQVSTFKCNKEDMEQIIKVLSEPANNTTIIRG
jgi:hypothetical protein